MANDAASENARFLRKSSVLSASLGPDEAALLGESREEYFGLNGTAVRVWELIAQPRSLAEICDVLVEEYDCDRDEIERDVRECLAELVADKLATRTP